MKTTLNIEITTADKLPVLMEEGDSWDNYTPAQKTECAQFQEEFAERVHLAFVRWFKECLFLEQALDYVLVDSETSVEGWEELADYKTKIEVKRAK